MKKDNTVKKAYYKVEASRLKNQPAGDYVAMITNDEHGPKYFYGSQAQCWAHIDSLRLRYAEDGVELVQQRPSGLPSASQHAA